MSEGWGETVGVCCTRIARSSQTQGSFSLQAASMCRGAWPCVSRFWEPYSNALGPSPSTPRLLSLPTKARNKADPVPHACVRTSVGPAGGYHYSPCCLSGLIFTVASNAPPWALLHCAQLALSAMLIGCAIRRRIPQLGISAAGRSERPASSAAAPGSWPQS